MRDEPAVTILICEDEPSLRELVHVALADPSFVFLQAGDGAEALELARRHRPDLVVLDLMLPGRSGQEVLAELRADPRLRHTKVLVLTAWTEARDEMLAGGADRFVAKPFEPEELRATVDELLAGG